jgi:prepilin-type N-terminal cleavage/methylation domain-containing protein
MAAGFTLVELLVTIGIASAVTLGITALLNADLRSNSTLLQFQRQRRQASHARRYIELEASRASQLQFSPKNPRIHSGVGKAHRELQLC